MQALRVQLPSEKVCGSIGYVRFSRCLTHLDFITGLFFFYSASATPNGASISWLTCCGVAYVQHLAVGNESLVP